MKLARMEVCKGQQSVEIKLFYPKCHRKFYLVICLNWRKTTFEKNSPFARGFFIQKL